MDLQEAYDRLKKLGVDAQAKLDEITDDTTPERANEIEREYEKITASYDSLEARIAKQEGLEEKKRQAEEREERLNRADPRRPTGEDVKTRGAAEETADPKKLRELAFRGYLRYGAASLPPNLARHLNQYQVQTDRGMEAELRAMGVTNPTAGGYTVPEGFMAELVKAEALWGPMMDPAVIRTMNTDSGAPIPWPTMDDTTNTGSLIAENNQVSSAEIAFGIRTFGAHDYTSGVVLVSAQLLQDSALDIEQIVRDAMAERIARISNTHLTTGDGANKPHGIVTAAGTGATAAAAAAIVFDDLINLEHSVDPAYRADPSCKWQFNDSTLKAVRKLKDGDGNYIWQPADVRAGAPTTISGYPYAINQAMASIGTGNVSAIFGAMKKYIVRLVNGFAILRLVERYADANQVGFIGFQRIDGNLLNPAAVKKLTHP